MISRSTSGVLEPASTGLQELICGLKSIMMGIVTPEKLTNSINEDSFLFPRELPVDIDQHAAESDTPIQVQILVFLCLLICELFSKALNITKPQFPHLQTGAPTSTGLM